jgi:hypothetical protein
MNKTSYVLLGLLVLSVIGNIVQSQHYERLLAQSEYVYDGTVEHLRATLGRELTALETIEDELAEEGGHD